MIRRSSLPRSTKPLKRSWVKRSRKPIPQENIEATRKRRLRNQKRMRSPEYKAAKAGAMERAGGRCEFEEGRTYEVARLDLDTGRPVTDGRGFLVTDPRNVLVRCPETDRLQFHEERYRKVGPVRAEDGKMLCPPHHRLVEKAKPHKWHKRGF